MQKVFLPFRQIRPLPFLQGISTEPRVPRAPTSPFVIALSSLRPHQPLSAAAVISFPVATVSRFSTLMAGKSQVLPADAWVCSAVTERKLEDLVHDGLLQPRASRSQPE
jgi:hypothetical protein